MTSRHPIPHCDMDKPVADENVTSTLHYQVLVVPVMPNAWKLASPAAMET